MKFRIILVFIIIVTQAKAQNLVRIWFDGVENNQLKVVTEVYLKSCNPPNHYEDIFLELEDLENKKTYKFPTNFSITKNYISFCNKPTEYSLQCYGDGRTYHFKRWWSVNYINLENLGCALNFSIQLDSVLHYSNTIQKGIYVSSWIDICNNPNLLIANYDTVSILNSNYSATESIIRVEIPDIETRNKSIF